MCGFLCKTARWILLFAIVMLNIGLFAQEADNEFTIDAKINTRGEIRVCAIELIVPNELPVLSGYQRREQKEEKGDCCGFHLFSTNCFQVQR